MIFFSLKKQTTNNPKPVSLLTVKLLVTVQVVDEVG